MDEELTENLDPTELGNTSSGHVPPPKISVIVPVYKVERYLPECIESVLAQTFTDFELILVDDGSPDNSGKICDDYAARDSRIRVFHKENGGVSSARSLGVDRARGEWIMFVDGDDILDVNGICRLIKEVDDDTDLVEGKILRFYESRFSTVEECSIRQEKISAKDYIVGVVYRRFSSGPVAKVFRKSLFTPEVMKIPSYFYVGEDFLMLLRIGGSALRNVKRISNVVYFYRQGREGSATNRFHVTEGYARKIYEERVCCISRYQGVAVEEFQMLKSGCALVSVRRFIREGTPFDRCFWLTEIRPILGSRALQIRTLVFVNFIWLIVFFRADWLLTFVIRFSQKFLNR